MGHYPSGLPQALEKIQDTPELLVSRTIQGVARHVFYGALHTHHREHVTHTRHPSFTQLTPSDDTLDHAEPILVFDAATFHPHSHESRQTDRRLDIHTALTITAQRILEQPRTIKQDRLLWALYCFAILQVSVTEASQFFGVDHRAMSHAYAEIREHLGRHLANYALPYPTDPVRHSRQTELPYQDITQIRQITQDATPNHFIEARRILDKQCSDTHARDILALDGIQKGLPAREQGRQHQIPFSSIQRAYERVHLILGSLMDKTITQRRPEKKSLEPFVMSPDKSPLIQQLAYEGLAHANSQVWLIALYSYLCHLPIRATARDFGLKEGTLRRYRHLVQESMTKKQTELMYPPVREAAESNLPETELLSGSSLDIDVGTLSSLDAPSIQVFEPLYPTRWRGAACFEDIFMDQNVRRVAFAKMRTHGYTDHDAEDCFQLGALNLWKTLKEQSQLLVDKGPAWVGVWIALSGSRRALWKHKHRTVDLEHLVKTQIHEGGA